MKTSISSLANAARRKEIHNLPFDPTLAKQAHRAKTLLKLDGKDTVILMAKKVALQYATARQIPVTQVLEEVKRGIIANNPLGSRFSD